MKSYFLREKKRLFLVLCFAFLLLPSALLFADTATTSVIVVAGECQDLTDNDEDGLTDAADPGCYDNGDVDTGTLIATNTEATQIKPLCDDGADNDFDGLEDYPADPGCESLLDEDETDVNSISGGLSRRITEDLALEGSLSFSGYGIPGTGITILADGVIIATVAVNDDATFDATLSNLTPGNYAFSLYASDVVGTLSATVPISATVIANTNHAFTDIIMPPIVTVGTTPGTAEGTTIPNTAVQLLVTGPNGTEILTLVADPNGVFTLVLDPTVFPDGTYTIFTRVVLEGVGESLYSRAVTVTLGEVLLPVCLSGAFEDADFNSDGRVNIVDASILTFWYNKVSGESRYDLNCSNTVDLVDLSILAYWWTG